MTAIQPQVPRKLRPILAKLLVALILGICLTAGSLYATANSDLPSLRDGDLIFQTSTSA